ncbi:MAG: glycosyltransferase family 4 protein [Vulcanimicrobiaceae bacterium]
MRVGLDLRATLGTPTGAGEYASGLYASLRGIGTEAVALGVAGFDLWRFDRRVVWDQIGLPLAAARAKVSLLHCTSGTVPLVASVPIVATVHDLAWSRVQGHTPPYARAYFGTLQERLVRRARAVIVDSQFSRGELLARIAVDPARVSVVFPGVDEAFGNLVRAPQAEPTILVVGTVEPRKNLELVVRVLARLPRVRALAVGPATPYRERCRSLAHELGVAERLDLRGFVARTELLALYAQATLAAVPSRYEGFGYAAAQALCAGVPLVCARGSALSEVVGEAAPLVALDDLDGWAEAVAAILRDRDAAQLRAESLRRWARERFAWEACARETAALYARALA